MAFKKAFGTGAKKFFFGAGIATVGTMALSHLAPQLANHPLAKVGEAALSYAAGGFEAAIGTAATILLGKPRGTQALDNVMTESL